MQLFAAMLRFERAYDGHVIGGGVGRSACGCDGTLAAVTVGVRRQCVDSICECTARGCGDKQTRLVL